jgi:hypothetical protein
MDIFDFLNKEPTLKIIFRSQKLIRKGRTHKDFASDHFGKPPTPSPGRAYFQDQTPRKLVLTL